MKASCPQTKRASWEAWYVRDKAALLAFVNGRTGSLGFNNIAEDIVQNAFEIGFRNIINHKYIVQKVSLYAYLKGIAKNLIREAVRCRQNDNKSQLFDDMHVEDKLGPEMLLVYKECLKSFTEAYSACSLQQREVLKSNYLQGMSSKEAACKLGLTPENIRIITYRAVAAMQQNLLHNHSLDVPAANIRRGLKSWPDYNILARV